MVAPLADVIAASRAVAAGNLSTRVEVRGPDDLRGFRRNRFRDDHLMLFQAEYRWEVFTAMDAAFFADWGKVASRRQDLTFDDLEHDYGFGVRFGTDNGVFLRIEGAFGSRAGKHFVFRFGDAF